MRLTETQLKQLRRHRTTGNRVAKAIELAGVTLVRVQQGTGLRYTYISDVAANRYATVTVAKAHVFAEFFGCAIEDLFPAQKAVAA